MLLSLLLLLEVATLLLEDHGGAAAGSPAACSGMQTPEGLDRGPTRIGLGGRDAKGTERGGGRVSEALNETCEIK